MQYIIAGGATGLFTRIISQPLDVIKVRLQVSRGFDDDVIQREKARKENKFDQKKSKLQVEPVTAHYPNSKYKGLVQAARCIYVEEGITAFWKGLSPALCLSTTYGAIQFASFENLSKYAWAHVSETVAKNAKLRHTVNFSCGAVSGMLATIGSFPFDVIRTRMIGQGNDKVYNGIFGAVRGMLMREGLRSFYKGLAPNMIHTFPATGLRFVYYKYLDDSWSRGETGLKGFINVTVGVIIGLGVKFVVYPLDVIKKRLQVQGFEEARRQFGSFPKCSGIVHCVQTMVRREGFASFYKGLSPCILKSALITFSYFLIYKTIVHQ